ncbi:DUF6957 family protein [Pseudomonas aeruginosa]|uniref:DUF6957 family protein n=1 Tax=Pseudomonas aeruginosa TaxID=287 RepID=UPI003916DC74
MAGCELSVKDARAWLNSMEPSRPFCLVAEWSWLDLDTPDNAQDRSGGARPPAVIYSNYVLFDSRYRFPVGGWVRSTMLVTLREGVIFETRNTRYLLMGPGVRKTTSLSAVGSIR